MCVYIFQSCPIIKSFWDSISVEINLIFHRNINAHPSLLPLNINKGIFQINFCHLQGNVYWIYGLILSRLQLICGTMKYLGFFLYRDCLQSFSKQCTAEDWKYISCLSNFPKAIYPISFLFIAKRLESD